MMPCEMAYSSFYPDKSNYEIVVTTPIYIYIFNSLICSVMNKNVIAYRIILFKLEAVDKSFWDIAVDGPNHRMIVSTVYSSV